jgi:uncharacterized protein
VPWRTVPTARQAPPAGRSDFGTRTRTRGPDARAVRLPRPRWRSARRCSGGDSCVSPEASAYSSNLVEGKFCGLRRYGVLRSSVMPQTLRAAMLGLAFCANVGDPGGWHDRRTRHWVRCPTPWFEAVPPSEQSVGGGRRPIVNAKENVERLREAIRDSGWFVGVLEAVRDCDPPNWLVGGGAVRNLVWNRLHGYRDEAYLNDVDVAYFDPEDLSRRRDQAVKAALQVRSPEVTWDIKNQAAVHLWYEKRFGFPVLPLRSVEEGIATFPETATSVGVRLTDDGDLYFHAPLGLQDLFDLALRRNPRRVTPKVFTRRAIEKEIVERWPKITVIHDGTDGPFTRNPR